MDVEIEGAEGEEEEEEEEFYTEGDQKLLEARQDIARFSLERAQKRIERQNIEAKIPLARHVKYRRQIYSDLKQLSSLGTQSGFERPVSATVFSPNSKLLASGDWSGEIKVLTVPSLETKLSHKGYHTGQISGISWHPEATISLSEEAVNFASGGLEGDIQLWNISNTSTSPLSTLKGHEKRVCKIDFHPSGKYLASASYDLTWRLWDVQTQQELLLQEGHSKEVFAVRFQNDGSLVGSAGRDAIGRIWDMRTGKTIMILDGHIREIYGLDFSPNGYQVVTGSADNSAIIWDIRQLKSIFTIPAHTNLVSEVRFFQGLPSNVADPSIPSNSGTFLATASYDHTIKVGFIFASGGRALPGPVVPASQGSLY